jgi:hypothetical protein
MAETIPNRWVALTAEIDGEDGGGSQPPACVGSLCSAPTIPSLTIPSLALPSPQAQLKPKKGKQRKHGKCVKKRKKKKR